MVLNAFPKIYAIGKREIENLFIGHVEVSEKVDGSQFSFGMDTDGQLIFRSKGKQIFFEAYDKMFHLAVEYLKNNQELLRQELAPNMFVYAEYLSKPKHNILNYGRVPKNNLIVFGLKIDGNFVTTYETIKLKATRLDLETVPLIYYGTIFPNADGYAQLSDFIEKTPSILGGEFGIEGIVVKNYNQHTSIGDPTICCGKYVKESFKEKHGQEWQTGTDKLQEFINSFRTEARWYKAIQHLRDQGLLENDPRDIGKLLAEVKKDLAEEEKESIKTFLYRHFMDQIQRKAIAGFPEFYKDLIMKQAFTNES